MTKTQAQARLKKLLEQLEDIYSELEDLNVDVNDTIDSIEPYEGKDELTDAQYERQEWFEDLAQNLDSVIWELDTIKGELDCD